MLVMECAGFANGEAKHLQNDREEIRYLCVSPQHLALWARFKQFREAGIVIVSLNLPISNREEAGF